MGTPINTPLTSEIWHLTIDDLLEPLPASPRLGGPGPFVINLSASTAPISVPMKAVAEHPGTHVYQIQRTEDRRVRYRLRLGPFETEAEAEALLATVREIYPSALTASAEPEDLRSIEGIRNKIEAQQLAAVKAAVSRAVAASLPNTRPGLARVAPPERPLVASAGTEALPTSPPPAWLALRTPSPAPAEHTVEPDVPAPAAKPSPKPPASVKVAAPAPAKSVRGFAPARWSPSARAFVPSVDVESAPPVASIPTVEKAQAGAAAPSASSGTAATVPASPATVAAPARADTPPVSVVPESLIPVLSDSMAVPRPTPASRPAVMTTLPVATAPPIATAPLIAIAPEVVTAPPVVTTPPVVPAAPPREAPAGTVSSPASALAPRMMPGPRAPAAAPRTEPQGARVANFDSTQTLRPLTPTELEDSLSLRWFVIQLSCSEQAFDPDALPNLDIFSEYRLYSVASLEQGRPMHTLRVGFFSEESHAKAVASYLGTFYNDPIVKRVSTAERTRFAQHRVEARKDIGATGKHAIIEITNERVIRPKRSGNASVPPMRPPLPAPTSVRGR